MRKIAIILSIVGLISILFATEMIIHKTDGTQETFQINEIESITFGQSDYIYSENFTSEPNFTSLAPDYAYWDQTSGNYYVNTYDNLENQYWAYSPQFTEVSGSSNYTIEFDLMCENGDWGTYPGVIFYNSEPTEINNPTRTLRVAFRWSDNTYRKLRVADDAGNDCLPDDPYEDSVWYHIKIDYIGNEEKADILITELSSGIIFMQELNADFVLQNISWLALGYYSTANYGDEWSPIRLDNVQIYYSE